VSNPLLKSLWHRVADEGFSQGNFGAVDELFAPSFFDHTAPLGTTVRGPAVLKLEITALRAAFPDLQLALEDMIEEGDTFAARQTLRGTHWGSFAGTPPTGRPVTLLAISYGRLSNGRVIESWTVTDNLSLLQQLGVVPPPVQFR
jgi:hypothetical protein